MVRLHITITAMAVEMSILVSRSYCDDNLLGDQRREQCVLLLIGMLLRRGRKRRHEEGVDGQKRIVLETETPIFCFYQEEEVKD